jgi:hypothetical protein
MARDHPLWGAERLRGELLTLGMVVSNRSIRPYRRAGRRRPPSQPWRTFLANHAAGIWACDLFPVPTLTFRTLSRMSPFSNSPFTLPGTLPERDVEAARGESP